MTDVAKHLRLTHAGVLKMVDAAVAKSGEIGVPMCIAVVDDGGNLLAFVRMDGGKLLSIDSSINKAITGASGRVPSGNVSPDVEFKLAHVTSGKLTNLKAGLPIYVDGMVVGGIGVGSGTGDQDLEVAKAGIAAIGASYEP